MAYTLVVVDMQDYFPAARGSTVQENCLREVKKAIQDRAGVIVLEYKHCGETIPAIAGLLKEYSRYERKVKDNDDGSRQVINSLRKRKFSQNLRVVGVNTDCCVNATVQSLSRKRVARIRVVADACNSTIDHGAGLDGMKRLPNVSIVNNKNLIIGSHL